MNKGYTKLQSLPNQSHASKTKSNKLRAIAGFLLKTLIFGALLILMAGHENVNPKVGYTNTEFYTTECRQLIRTEYKKSFLIVDSKADSSLVDYHQMAMEFFRYRAFHPAWTINFTTSSEYKDIIKRFEQARYLGLDSSYYNTNEIKVLTQSFLNERNDDKRLQTRINLEIELTKAVFKYLVQTSSGIGNCDTSDVYTNFIGSLPRFLNYAIDNGNLLSTIDQLQPDFFQYKYLKNALAIFIDNTTIDSFTIKIDNGVKKYQVIRQLVNLNYLAKADQNDPEAFNKSLVMFQKQHGLKQTGEINKKTLMQLAVSTNHKYYQIALNLDRLRKMAITDSNCVFVNIPEYKLKVLEGGRVVSQYNVMVGRYYTPTPEISSKIHTVVANPYWTVPKSITFNEMLPRIRKDSTYLKRNGYFLIDKQEQKVTDHSINWNTVSRDNFDYWIRQANGGGNALGVLKFQFNNKHRIFIHDTQSKRLFNSDIRAYSHGCIRLENPELLANYLVSKYSAIYDEDFSINSIIRRKARERISLDRQIPVHIKYVTCAADEKGNLYFFTDIYNKDKKEIEELFMAS